MSQGVANEPANKGRWLPTGEALRGRVQIDELEIGAAVAFDGMQEREAIGGGVVHEPELLLGASEQGICGGANARVVGLSSPDDSTKQRPAEKGSGERGERLVGGEEEHRRRLKLRPPCAFAREAAREDGRRRANATHHSTSGCQARSWRLSAGSAIRRAWLYPRSRARINCFSNVSAVLSLNSSGWSGTLTSTPD